MTMVGMGHHKLDYDSKWQCPWLAAAAWAWDNDLQYLNELRNLDQRTVEINRYLYDGLITFILASFDGVLYAIVYINAL